MNIQTPVSDSAVETVMGSDGRWHRAVPYGVAKALEVELDAARQTLQRARQDLERTQQLLSSEIEMRRAAEARVGELLATWDRFAMAPGAPGTWGHGA